ncbi:MULTISPECIES: hypothetical protein [Latilactobacillus]|uniref:Uncharacterized protein n=3 Tax=Latilactobacillus curvatus TaxID=28038 RepID=A0A1B2A4B0_LATCU|nr:hypothetical protein [Latilactobacillus curvatus]ANJ68678.1 hypothetical protein FBA2_00975 [Latilactobacillus curvatus]ANY12795.1 hypothetical protein BCY75_01460 [Latilactobacillus curvatus]AOO76217.1 hypothetical protein LCW_09480 [Latilactobacillus curvatus]ASN60905.1 hypothetical protein CG419_09875 [Latilactobacillus curvatus]AWV73668.1 hypothetical protein C0W45_09255 [Latilactobacillus curvatus]
MQKEVPIRKVRLGRSTVKTPELCLVIKKESANLKCFLEGMTDLEEAILRENNGEALVGESWGPLEFDHHGRVFSNKTVKRCLQKLDDNQ